MVYPIIISTFRSPFSGGSKNNRDVSEATMSWFNEKDDYNYSKLKCDKGKVCGHYTQVPGFGGGARIFFSDLEICMSQSDMLRMAKPCALLGWFGGMPPEKFF